MAIARSPSRIVITLDPVGPSLRPDLGAPLVRSERERETAPHRAGATGDREAPRRLEVLARRLCASQGFRCEKRLSAGASGALVTFSVAIR